MKNIYLFSNYEFLVEIENKNYFLDSTKNIQIKDFNINTIIKIYPINSPNLSIPFCLKFDIKNGCLVCNYLFIKIYDFKDRYEVFIYPYKILNYICLLNKKININNSIYNIYCYKDRIKITNNFEEYIYEINADNFTIDKKDNNIFVLCQNKIKHLIVFNTNKKIFYEINGNKIEINKNDIKTLNCLDDCFAHNKVTLFNISNNFEITENNLYVNKNKSFKYNNNALKPIYIFDLIKANNPNLQSYITNNLSKNTNFDLLKSFFGDFYSFNLKSIDPIIYTLYYENQAKDFKFFIKDGLIDDIEEI